MLSAIFLSSKSCCRLTCCYVFLLLFIFISVLTFLLMSLYIVYGSFWLASLFLQVSPLVTKINDLKGNPGLPLPTLFDKKFSCCVSYRLVEVGNHGVQISMFIYHHGKRYKSTTIVACKALFTVGSFIQLLVVMRFIWAVTVNYLGSSLLLF